MKKLLVVLAIVAMVGLGLSQIQKIQTEGPVGGGGPSVTYYSSTQATTTANPYTWSSVLAADSTKRYGTVCNDSITSNDAVYLGFGATSSKPYGYRLASGSCYELND